MSTRAQRCPGCATPERAAALHPPHLRLVRPPVDQQRRPGSWREAVQHAVPQAAVKDAICALHGVDQAAALRVLWDWVAKGLVKHLVNHNRWA
jgi:hypothetical protein